MTTCCPTCASPEALGTEAFAACVECGSVALAGLSLPTAAIVLSVVVVAATLAVRGLGRALETVRA